MNLKTQKKLAAQIMGCSPSKIVFDTERLEDIKESITKVDIKALIKANAISKKNPQGPSKVRARKNAEQKKKGRKTGTGRRKGKASARQDPKRSWINRIRKQREILKALVEKETITKEDYKILYRRAGGGFFRSARHLKLYVTDLINKKN